MRSLKVIIIVILLGFMILANGCSKMGNKSDINKEADIFISTTTPTPLPDFLIKPVIKDGVQMIIYTNNSFIVTNGEIIKAKIKDTYKKVKYCDKTLWGIYGVLGIFSLVGIIRLIKKIKRGKK
jgi:hypothetical protein